ncbi:hypothetical protein ACOSQ2_003953 [Xanthoceras sorbifolium]
MIWLNLLQMIFHHEPYALDGPKYRTLQNRKGWKSLTNDLSNLLALVHHVVEFNAQDHCQIFHHDSETIQGIPP